MDSSPRYRLVRTIEAWVCGQLHHSNIVQVVDYRMIGVWSIAIKKAEVGAVVREKGRARNA